MELREYWAIIRRRWWLPVGLALLVGLITMVVQKPWRAAPANYSASMRFNVGIQPERIPGVYTYDRYYSMLTSEYLVDDLGEIVRSQVFANEVSQRLATIPGVGPVTALTLATEINAAAFESGRHLAAWVGLTPKEHSTGGRQRMGGISRAGNERLRVLLVIGATSVIQAAVRPGSKQMTDWLRALLQRKPRKVAAVALANKMARVAWALMVRGNVYRRPTAAAGAAAA